MDFIKTTIFSCNNIDPKSCKLTSQVDIYGVSKGPYWMQFQFGPQNSFGFGSSFNLRMYFKMFSFHHMRIMEKHLQDQVLYTFKKVVLRLNFFLQFGLGSKSFLGLWLTFRIFQKLWSLVKIRPNTNLFYNN